MNQQLKSIKIIHIGLVMGLTAAYFFIGELEKLEFLSIPEIEGNAYLYLVIPLLAIFLGNMLYRQQLKSADKALPLEKKFGIYQTASIIRWAVLEMVAFIILFLKKELILIGILLIVYMLWLRPSEEGMKRDFQLYGK